MTGAIVRRLAPLLVACAAVAGPPSTATAAPAAAGTMVVTATRSASATIHVRGRVRFDVYRDVRFAPVRGRKAAVVLKRAGGWAAPNVMAVHTGFCATPGCRSHVPHSHLGSVWAPGSSVDGIEGWLPPGTYHVYVVTDGAPVTVTLRFRGLPGTRRLTARAPVRAAVTTAKPTVAEPAAAPAAFAGGSTFAIGPRGGMHAVSLWKEVPFYVTRSAAGLCEYRGGPPSDGRAPAYHSPCSGGSGDVLPWAPGAWHAGPATTPYGPGRFVTGLYAGYLLPPDETWGIGGYHNTAGPVTAAYVHQLWLDF